jgi:hypothetical protein
VATTLVFNVVAHDGASASLAGIGRSVDNNSGKWRKMSSAIKIAGRAAASGLLVAAAAGGFMAKSAADDQLAVKQLSVAMVNNAHATTGQQAAVEKWISRVGIAKGVADDDLRPALTRLVTATHDVTKAQDLAKLGMNIAAGTGKDLTTVTTALAKAQNGSVSGLSRLGIATKDAAGKTLDFDTLQKRLAKTFQGQASQAAGTASGQYARLKVMLSEAAESIGYKLLPYAVKLGAWMINTGIPATQKLGGWLKDHLGPALSEAASWFQKSSAKGGDLSDSMKDVSSFVDDVKRAWKALSPFIETAAKDTFPALVQMIRVQTKGLKAMGDTTIWLWNNAFAPFFKVVLAAFSNLSRTIGETLKLIGKAPGMGWVGDLGNKLVGAANKADDLSSKIRLIPDHKTVTVSVTTHYATTGKPTPNAPGAVGGPARTSGHAGSNLTQAGTDLIMSLVSGLSKGKVPAQRVLDAVTQELSDRVDRWKAKLQQAADFADSFKGWALNAFSATGEDGAPATLAQILAQAHGQESTSAQVNADVQKLISMNLSKDLVEQLQSEGASGIDAIHTLASASQAQIDELNRANANTQANYAAAGLAAADRVYAADIAQAEASKNIAAALLDVIQGVKDLKNVEFVIKGNDLVAVIDKDKKDKGKK